MISVNSFLHTFKVFTAHHQKNKWNLYGKYTWWKLNHKQHSVLVLLAMKRSIKAYLAVCGISITPHSLLFASDTWDHKTRGKETKYDVTEILERRLFQAKLFFIASKCSTRPHITNCISFFIIQYFITSIKSWKMESSFSARWSFLYAKGLRPNSDRQNSSLFKLEPVTCITM